MTEKLLSTNEIDGASVVRFDRNFSIGLAKVMRALPQRQTASRLIPILMYHSVSKVLPDPPMHPYFGITTAPATFRRQMAMLQHWGYTVIPLASLKSFGRDPGLLPQRPVVITFDDGLIDFYERAFPILSDFGFTATVFLPTAFIDGNGHLPDRQHMNWSQVKELYRKGIDFGSHTRSHPLLIDLPWSMVEREIADSRDTLEMHLGESIAGFSYPFAFPEHDKQFVERFSMLLESAGFSVGVSTRIGCSTLGDLGLYRKRIPVNDFDDGELFGAKLDGAYDWMGILQHSAKMLRRRSGRHSRSA